LGAVAAADFRGDGSTDLVGTNQSLGGVSVFLNAPRVALFPDKLAFGPEAVGTTSNPRAILVSNPSIAPLAISEVVANGDFVQTNTCPVFPATLAAKASCVVSVKFRPGVPNYRIGEITIHDDSPGSIQVISLSGIATLPADFALAAAPRSGTIHQAIRRRTQ
jgi:hypothetical protein